MNTSRNLPLYDTRRKREVPPYRPIPMYHYDSGQNAVGQGTGSKQGKQYDYRPRPEHGGQERFIGTWFAAPYPNNQHPALGDISQGPLYYLPSPTQPFASYGFGGHPGFPSGEGGGAYSQSYGYPSALQPADAYPPSDSKRRHGSEKPKSPPDTSKDKRAAYPGYPSAHERASAHPPSNGKRDKVGKPKPPPAAPKNKKAADHGYPTTLQPASAYPPSYSKGRHAGKSKSPPAASKNRNTAHYATFPSPPPSGPPPPLPNYGDGGGPNFPGAGGASSTHRHSDVPQQGFKYPNHSVTS